MVVSASGYESGSDELGMFVRMSVDPEVFSEVVTLKAAYWLTGRYYVFIAKNATTNLLVLEFRLKEGDEPGNLKAVCGEFCNSLLDHQLRQIVLNETKEIRSTLIRKAFFDARASLPKTATSDESYLPHEGESFHNDNNKLVDRPPWNLHDE